MPYYDAATVKAAANGRWIDILAQLGVESALLRNVHGPCPGCGGRDRFRFDDNDGDGTFICSQGSGEVLSGDGFTLLQHVKIWDWKKCITEVAGVLGLDPSAPPKELPPAKKPDPPLPKPKFETGKLAEFAKRWRDLIDTAWLADRSPLDPVRVTAQKFLSTLYRPSEKVIIFTIFKSQGQCVWPDNEIPIAGPEGVWFLAQPVDGEVHPNPRNENKPSRRSEESVTAWRFLLLESDEADPRDWIGALVQLPLAISAIYTSAGKSIHALVRVDAGSKEEWDDFAESIERVLITLGACPGSLSAVRLTRLPNCLRGARLQKLLYLNPDASAKPLCVMPRTRDIVKYWTSEGAKHLDYDCGEIIANFPARDLNDCIEALDRHNNRHETLKSCLFALDWFSTSPPARMLLERLRTRGG
jgi:hypothetical protein